MLVPVIMRTSKCTLSQLLFSSISRMLCIFSDSVISFKICDPYQATFGITDLHRSLIERAQTTLRHVVGARTVLSVVTGREGIAFEIAEIVGDIAENWGVVIEGVLIKDVIYDPEVFASSYPAAIQSREEVENARLMNQAGDIFASPAAMQMMHLEACTFTFYSKTIFQESFFI